MKRCNHSHWLSLGTYGNEISLLESDRLQMLTHHLQDPDTQRPSLFVLIGNTSKSLALRELFRTKKAPRFRSKRHAGEIHLHLDPSRIFHSRPVLIADGDLPQQSLRAKVPAAEKCCAARDSADAPVETPDSGGPGSSTDPRPTDTKPGARKRSDSDGSIDSDGSAGPPEL